MGSSLLQHPLVPSLLLFLVLVVVVVVVVVVVLVLVVVVVHLVHCQTRIEIVAQYWNSSIGFYNDTSSFHC